MKSVNPKKSLLSINLAILRERDHLTQEEVAERVGVSRQAVAKWESGESAPDIANCDRLAALYDVSLDDMVHYDHAGEGTPGPPPRDKYIFGTAQLGERGQIVLPKKARDTFGLKAGDMLMVLGDTAPETAGIALVRADSFVQMMEQVQKALQQKEEDE